MRRGIARVLDAEGRIDVLVNNAGLGFNAVVEEIDIEAAKDVFDVNYWGVVRCTQAVLPGMREQGSGTIVNISSIAGRLAAIAQAVYASSKWALECLSENMAQELAPFGIRVKVIEPGVTRTALLAKHQELHPDSPYADAYRRMFAFYATGIGANVRPSAVAEVVQQAIEDTSARLRYVCAYGGDEPGRRPRGRERRGLAGTRVRGERRRVLRPLRAGVRPRHPQPATSAPTSSGPPAL